MKKNFFVLFIGMWLLAAPLPAFARKPLPAVDPRMELVSIVANFAQLPGFTKPQVKAYNKKISEHFKNFEYHPVLSTARKMYKEHNFQYDAVLNLAVHLIVGEDSVTLDRRFPATFQEDTRICNPLTERFVAELNDFYREWDLARFFRENEPFYTLFRDFMVENVTEKIHYEWIGDFFGTDSEGLEIVLTLLTGTNNYGANTIDSQGNETIYASICCFTNSDGKPSINPMWAVSTIVHEIAHSFSNPLIDRNMENLEPFAMPIYLIMGKKIENTPYSAVEAVYYEAFVRTIQLLYAKRFDPESYKEIRDYELSLGFFWLEDFAALLEHYDANRDRYPTMEEFMTEVIRFYAALARTDRSPS